MSGRQGPHNGFHTARLEAFAAAPTTRFLQEARDLCIDPLTFTYHGCPYILR